MVDDEEEGSEAEASDWEGEAQGEAASLPTSSSAGGASPSSATNAAAAAAAAAQQQHAEQAPGAPGGGGERRGPLSAAQRRELYPRQKVEARWVEERSASDPVVQRHYRFMDWCRVGEEGVTTLAPGGVPCVRLSLCGNSFMLHQIRWAGGGGVMLHQVRWGQGEGLPEVAG